MQLHAQQRFKAGAVIGVNASQIDGDRSAGYTKLGLVGGLQGIAILTEKTELGLQILYSQRGSQSAFNQNNANFPFKIRINYIEVPVLYTYKDWLFEGKDGDYYKVHIHGGLSYGRLFETEIEDESLTSPLVQLGDEFNEDDISIVLGATYFANEHFGFTVRWSRSLNLLYRNESTNLNARSMRGKFITFTMAYIL